MGTRGRWQAAASKASSKPLAGPAVRKQEVISKSKVTAKSNRPPQPGLIDLPRARLASEQLLAPRLRFGQYGQQLRGVDFAGAAEVP